MNKSILGLAIGLLIFCLYWFGIRPWQVRQNCWENAKKMASDVAAMEIAVENRGQIIEKKADYEKVRDDRLKACLLEHGLER